jgi:hypothetical protein
MVSLLAFENYETWTTPLEAVPEKGSSRRPAAKPEGVPPTGDSKDGKSPPSVASYIFVAEKNPFHPERKEFPVIAQPQALAPKPPPVRPQVTLYGITIVGDYRAASISYAGRVLRKGEREVMTARVGERIGQYQLAQITEDRIRLEHPEDRFEVFLYDAKRPKTRVAVKTENKPAVVTSTVPGSPAPAGSDGAKPGQPPVAAAAATGGVAMARAPVPVTPAGTPPAASSRVKRFFNPRTPGEGTGQ